MKHWVMDYETLKNCFIAVFKHYKTDETEVFVIHKNRNNLKSFLEFLSQNIKNKEWHISYNGLAFDAQITHFILDSSDFLMSLEADEVANLIYKEAQSVITKSNKREFQTYPEWHMRIPQIDVFKLNHWDNMAKRSSLKWIEYTMDWENILDMPIHHESEIITNKELDIIIEYCMNDVDATKEIYNRSKSLIGLRLNLTEEYNINLINASEPRISKELFSYYLSDELNISKYELKSMRTYREVIKLNDIISYSFKQTKREDILTSVKMFYRYDYGQKKYYHYHEQKTEDLLDGYTGLEMYNLDPTDSHKDINLKYHSDRLTVEDFAQYTLLNNCNPHNMVEMTLPLNYMNLSVGDKIHIPLINNEKIFNIDYSKVDFLNGQPIYPLWMIMETNVGTTSVKIKAYQLHYLGVDGNHQFEMPDTEYEVIGNTSEFSNYTYPNGNQVPNWNYNPNANVESGFQIPYFDVTGDGVINVNDIIAVVNHITGNSQLNNTQKERLKYNSNGVLKTDNIINVGDLVSLVNIITNE